MKAYNSNIVLELFADLDLDVFQIKEIKQDSNLSFLLDSIAHRRLTNRVKAVYFILRNCTNTLDEAVEIYSDVYRKVDPESIRRSGKRAKEKVILAALESPEIKEWKTAWLEKNNNLKAAG